MCRKWVSLMVCGNMTAVRSINVYSGLSYFCNKNGSHQNYPISSFWRSYWLVFTHDDTSECSMTPKVTLVSLQMMTGKQVYICILPRRKLINFRNMVPGLGSVTLTGISLFQFCPFYAETVKLHDSSWSKKFGQWKPRLKSWIRVQRVNNTLLTGTSWKWKRTFATANASMFTLGCFRGSWEKRGHLLDENWFYFGAAREH